MGAQGKYCKLSIIFCNIFSRSINIWNHVKFLQFETFVIFSMWFNFVWILIKWMCLVSFIQCHHYSLSNTYFECEAYEVIYWYFAIHTVHITQIKKLYVLYLTDSSDIILAIHCVNRVCQYRHFNLVTLAIMVYGLSIVSIIDHNKNNY